MVSATVSVQGVTVPRILYGTAWKEDKTAALVEDARAAGFVGIDTANQRKHYFEAAVGEGLRRAGVSRTATFLQTKFTSVDGQDERLPYDPRADVETQVRQSFASSLDHLGVDAIDVYLMHGPTYREGLTDEDWAVWRAMEALHEERRVRLIGVSNFSSGQLELLVRGSKVHPALVQNRCYARSGWDRAVRGICATEGMGYEGFSLLTANRQVWTSSRVGEIAERLRVTPAEVVLRYALELDMIVLTGTTNRQHMRDDLAIFGLELSREDLAALSNL